jgi:uncharacterized protein
MKAMAYPFVPDGRGRAATVEDDAHIRQMIEEVLFTSPGERVMRPSFGCGVKALLFKPNSDVLAGTTRMLVKGALQTWLEDEIQVEAVDVTANEAMLVITIAYQRRTGGRRIVERFTPSQTGGTT